MGNIATYNENGTTYTYTYDTQNQLIQATDGTTTYTYTYDNAGNILTANGNTYTYGNAVWRDLLTAFNGETITYDGSGNPLSYYNGKRYTFTWEEGRNLVTAAEGTNTYTYAYDSNGLRVSKTVNGVKHEYLYASGKLLRETIYDASGNVTDILDFIYDHNGYPFALNYTADGTTTRYYYITNLQGDVLAMITGQGVVVASYSYDPYGKVISATKEMADINPLRYRGYYYDAETGFYYLQSRYYDPGICRFINADAYASTGQGIIGCNMFAYCLNNPSSMFDTAGTLPFFVVTAVAGALLGGIIGYATTGSLEGALAGVAIGGLFGLAGGAATASLLAGNVFASTGEVIAGGIALLSTTATAILTQAERIAQQVGKTYRALTQSNFRYNLQQLTGNLGDGMQAHHVFPQKFIEAFSKAGINIHNPLFGSWVDSTHQSWSNAYNQAWEAFFQIFQNPTAKQIFEKAAELAKQYGFEIYFK